MNTVLALAGVVIKELYRRKDFYVLFVLTALLTLTMGSVHFFNDAKIAGYLKEICLLLIWVSGLVIAVATTARQIPTERENRTIFPLLAKPVTRGQVIVGKFLGCWFAVGIALLVFYVFLIVLNGTREGSWPVMKYVQGLLLQWMMLGIVVALTLLGSMIFSAPSANITITLVVVVGVLLLGGHLNQVALRQSQPLQSVTYAIYYLIPHLEWFDIRDLIIYNHDIVPWVDCMLASLYAMVYAALFLFLSWLSFWRKPLTA
jgi:ABC-type transport system involved in multi-copper enzyme maturation permease subunit